MKKLVGPILYPLILVGIVGLISCLNYTPGTYLSGWDTLQPELDFGLNFSRLFSGVWRPEQGLGAAAGHSHMADLPRVVILWLLHFILPLNMLRYAYVFLCLFVGPLGLYYLIKYLLKNKHIAFLSALFYLFNLGTLQQFFVPFEMFTTQYAALPWIMLFSLQFLNAPSIKAMGGRAEEHLTKAGTPSLSEEERGQAPSQIKSSGIWTKNSKKSLFFFALVTLIATPQAYAAHLWYFFFGTYTLFILWYSFLHKIHLKKALVLLLVTLAINSFWLLPNLYYIKTSGDIPRLSKQNRLYSQEYRLRNRENGYIQDVALLRGFYFNWTIYDFEKERFSPLMQGWRRHLENPGVLAIGYAMFTAVIVGLLSVLRKKKRAGLAFLPFFVIPFALLMNHTPPFSWIFDQLTRISLFEEAFRFVFTKFSIMLTFACAVFFAYSLEAIFKRRRYIAPVVAIVTVALVIFAIPYFKGELVSPKMRIQIPREYFQMWEYMKAKPDGTVLSMNLYDFAGWGYYRFGYQGAGFVWFGLKQPILDRDFDRWSVSNEQAFREIQHAVYSRDTRAVRQALQKYNIRYLLRDQNIITARVKNQKQVVYEREIDRLLSELLARKVVKKSAEFGNISIYEVRVVQPAQLVQSLSQVTPAYHFTPFDYAYELVGPYFTSSQKGSNALHFPFRDITDEEDRAREELLTRLPKSSTSFNLQELYRTHRHIKTLFLKKEDGRNILTFATTNDQKGIYVDLSKLKHNLGYMLVIESRNKEGLPLRFCVKNLYSDLCGLYDEVGRQKEFKKDVYFIAPSGDALGYGLSIDNLSFGNYESVNDLASVALIPFPYGTLSGMYSGSAQKAPIALSYSSYHPGWKAYQIPNSPSSVKTSAGKQFPISKLLPFLFGRELRDHVLVNNWANGWVLPKGSQLTVDSSRPNSEQRTVNSEQSIVIVFWPQYLEYIGFFILVITFIMIVVIL